MAYIHLSPSHPNTFFAIAATLIPLLLFGGIVADRLRPPSGKWRFWHSTVTFYIPLFGAIAIVAEVSAIQAVVTGGTSGYLRSLVAGTLVLGMLSIVAAVWAPWLARMREAESGPYRLVVYGAAIVVVLFGVHETTTLSRIVDVATLTEKTDILRHVITAVREKQNALQRRERVRTYRIARLTRLKDQAIREHNFSALKNLTEALDMQLLLARLDFREGDRLTLESANAFQAYSGRKQLSKLPRAVSAQDSRHKGGN